ncbi:MAG: hypothetical protein NTY30_04955 [Candidatus Berkelbacteria bacterium]|nr:hypothetical protein [Candidatus Berkelbacteria bacterium]
MAKTKQNQNLPSEEDLVSIKQLLDSAENQIRKAKSLIFKTEIEEKAKEVAETSLSDNITEGIFDGENFVSPDGSVYPIPANYASKSKLVTGDVLKLTILPDGSFVYKQINPVERKKIVGELEEFGEGWRINVGGQLYNVLTASVTYFKAKVGDKIVGLIPEDGKSEWAAIENIMLEEI